MSADDKSKPVGQQQDDESKMVPGDEAPPGAAGAGEDLCPTCNGSGRVDGDTCQTCKGSGKVVRGIGGA